MNIGDIQTNEDSVDDYYINFDGVQTSTGVDIDKNDELGDDCYIYSDGVQTDELGDDCYIYSDGVQTSISKLPEFIDCTARTGLDMLAKHYYQAASTWVVFFAPESDADIEFYNEFMHYLEEKLRAAVAKLDDRTTLFLVPPFEFSEKVLKVPGKLSIYGVILRLENSDPNTLPLQNTHFNEEPQFLPSYTKPRSPPGAYASMSSYPNMMNSGVSDHMVHQRQNTSGFDSNFNGKSGSPEFKASV